MIYNEHEICRLGDPANPERFAVEEQEEIKRALAGLQQRVRMPKETPEETRVLGMLEVSLAVAQLQSARHWLAEGPEALALCWRAAHLLTKLIPLRDAEFQKLEIVLGPFVIIDVRLRGMVSTFQLGADPTSTDHNSVIVMAPGRQVRVVGITDADFADVATLRAFIDRYWGPEFDYLLRCMLIEQHGMPEELADELIKANPDIIERGRRSGTLLLGATAIALQMIADRREEQRKVIEAPPGSALKPSIRRVIGTWADRKTF